MTFHWKTDSLVADLEKIPGVVKVLAGDSGGDYDTREIVVFADGADEEKEHLHLSGYPSTEEICQNIDDAQCVWVELTDGQDSRGGLNSKHPMMAQVYFSIVLYLSERGAEVIPHYNKIF